jgi:hypothetical protein
MCSQADDPSQHDPPKGMYDSVTGRYSTEIDDRPGADISAHESHQDDPDPDCFDCQEASAQMWEQIMSPY